MKTCSKCGAEANDTAKFCRKCGSSLKQFENIFCPECGTKCAADDIFCPECGYKVAEETADVSLDESFALYKSGMEELQHANAKIEQTKKAVLAISKDGGVEVFEGDE